MANLDAPFGLKPVRHRLGVEWEGCLNLYGALSTYATALFVNDPVVRVASGSNAAAITAGVRSHKIATIPTVQKATAGDGAVITGVIVGFEPDINKPVGLNHRLASTARAFLVCDDEFVVYHLRDDGAAALTGAAVGLNANLIFTHTGNTTTGISQAELDTNSDGPDADASNQLRILRLADIANNDVGANAVWEVVINQSSEAPGALGI